MNDTSNRTALPSDDAVAAAIRAALDAPDSARTIDPSVPARALMDESEWQRALPAVRRVAIRLAHEGALSIYRKGKPVDPSDFRGVYRLGPPVPAQD